MDVVRRKKNKNCDVGSACDHRITAHVDTSYPQKGWPGVKTPQNWKKVFEKNDENSPVVNKVVTEDVCAGAVRNAVLRIHVEDVDSGTTNDFVDDFECSCAGLTPATSEAQAYWSPEKPCSAKYNPDTKITYRCRAYQIPQSSCGRPSGR